MPASRTTATVLAAVAVWRRASAGARPRRYVELRLLVDDPRDPASQLPAELTIADGGTYRRGQQIDVVVDLRTGAVALVQVERPKARPDFRFAGFVLVGIAVAVAVIGGLVYVLSLSQSRQAPTPTPMVSVSAS